jgi:hypothetical protein
MKYIHKIALTSVFLSLLASGIGMAQTKSQSDLIQFSGVVVSNDSLQPIPFANVIIRRANRGTVTDYYGFFSFVAMKGDTIDFLYIGYKPTRFVIPDSLAESRYSLIQSLTRDTILLKEATVYPWPTKEEFKRAFLELQLPDDDMKRAQRNIDLAQRRDVQSTVPDDGRLNYIYAQQERQTRLYSAGQYPVNNLLNPLAWASFIKAWKDGTFKRKD